MQSQDSSSELAGLQELRPVRFVLLLIGLGLLVILSPILEGWEAGRILEVAFFAIVIFTSCLIVKPKRLYLLATFTLALVTSTMWGLSQLSDAPFFNAPAFHLTTNGLAAIFLSITAGIILADVLDTGAITVNRLCGAISVYLFIGLIFGFMFQAVHMVLPDAFNIDIAHSQRAVEASQHWFQNIFMFYSFVTLTTLGYGDVIPTMSITRTMSWTEALVGQMYLTVLVARLVGLHIAWHTTEALVGSQKANGEGEAS